MRDVDCFLFFSFSHSHRTRAPDGGEWKKWPFSVCSENTYLIFQTFSSLGWRARAELNVRLSSSRDSHPNKPRALLSTRVISFYDRNGGEFFIEKKNISLALLCDLIAHIDADREHRRLESEVREEEKNAKYQSNYRQNLHRPEKYVYYWTEGSERCYVVFFFY